MLTQSDWVKGCLAFYAENDLTPGDPNDGRWEEAHYPLPKGEGTETVLLLHEHHQVQGLLQSGEVGRCCFFPGHAKRLLSSSFTPHWFELWELYEKWVADAGRTHGRKSCRKAGLKAAELGVGAFGLSAEERSKARVKGGKAAAAQVWASLHDGWLSTAAGVGTHNRAVGADPASRVRLSPRDFLYLLPLETNDRLQTLERLKRDSQPQKETAA